MAVLALPDIVGAWREGLPRVRLEECSLMKCQTCQQSFEPAKTPLCPVCLARMWLSTDRFIRPKHDPRELPLVWESYRSVLSPDFVEQPEDYLEFAAHHGTWYFDRYYEMYVHLSFEPLDRSPGGGVPAGRTSPEHALDSLIIAEANSAEEAHGFAVNRSQFESQISAGEFEVLGSCPAQGCSNPCVPGDETCMEHR